jgi:RNA polymerase sigma-70 factor (ECF subfamily)
MAPSTTFVETTAVTNGGADADTRTPADLEERKVELIRAHLTSVWGFLRRLGLSPADAEDAGQEVFITALRKMDAIYEGQEKRFLFGIALRIASRRHRSNKSLTSRAASVDVDSCESVGPTTDEYIERKEALALLDEALATMNDEMRTVFVLYELEEMTMPEIAALIDAPLPTLASRLRRAREQFQKATHRLRARRP